MKLGFLILAHDNPANTARLAKRLLDSGSVVCLHYDLKAGDAPLEEIKQRLGPLAEHLILPKRVRVSWGEWSIIEATLNGLSALLGSGQELDYIHLISGADYPIRPISDFRDFLERQSGVDFIESHALSRKQWVKDGLTRERYQYRHFFNFKAHPKLFHWCWKIQSFLKIRRKPPGGLPIHMGSQWWTLTAATCRHVLELGRSARIVRFFRHSWIPDEMVVQTLAAQTGRKHSNRHLTLYQFNDYGVPIVFYDSHAEFLSRQPFFFARKLSPFAGKLRDELDRVVSGEMPVRHFHDWEIGTPTSEYDQFKAQHRKGVPGRRLPGQTPHWKLGELAWSQRRYLVIAGTSRFELEQAAKLVRHIPSIECHGFLFAAHEVDFAKDAESIAGYARTGTALRDQAPPTFLTDVVNAQPEKTTCFLLRREEARTFFDDALRMDPNASIVLLRGGSVRAYADIHGTARSGQPGHQDDDNVLIEAAKVSAFQDNFAHWIEEALPVKDEDAPSSEPFITARFHHVDMLSQQWPGQLIDAILESGVDVGQVAALRAVGQATALRPSPVDKTLVTALLSLGQSRESKTRVLAEVLAPVKTPYLAVVCPGRQSAETIADQLRLNGWFSGPETQPDTVTDLLGLIMEPRGDQGGRAVVLALGADDVSLIDAIMLDPDARILAVESAIRPVESPAVKHIPPYEMRRSVTEEWRAFEAKLAGAAGSSVVVKGTGSDWAREAAHFVASGFPDLEATRDKVAEAIRALMTPSSQEGTSWSN